MYNSVQHSSLSATEIPSCFPVSTHNVTRLHLNVLGLEIQKRKERISKNFSILVLWFFLFFFKVSDSFHFGLMARSFHVFNFARVWGIRDLCQLFRYSLRWTCLTQNKVFLDLNFDSIGFEKSFFR
jgi:hypothetical protein